MPTGFTRLDGHRHNDSAGILQAERPNGGGLFRYPCSFLIYSPAFDAMPEDLKSYLWRRLEQILTGAAPTPTYAAMPAGNREAVLNILRETKPEFAARVKK